MPRFRTKCTEGRCQEYQHGIFQPQRSLVLVYVQQPIFNFSTIFQSSTCTWSSYEFAARKNEARIHSTTVVYVYTHILRPRFLDNVMDGR